MACFAAACGRGGFCLDSDLVDDETYTDDGSVGDGAGPRMSAGGARRDAASGCGWTRIPGSCTEPRTVLAADAADAALADAGRCARSSGAW